MTIEDIKEYKKNAVTILEKNSQYATARAVEQAFSAMVCLGQYMWERDLAIEQLEEFGISLGQKVDHVKELVDKDNIQDAVYKDGIFVCPNCGKSIFPLSLYDGDYCIKCGQHVGWRGVIK